MHCSTESIFSESSDGDAFNCAVVDTPPAWTLGAYAYAPVPAADTPATAAAAVDAPAPTAAPVPVPTPAPAAVVASPQDDTFDTAQ